MWARTRRLLRMTGKRLRRLAGLAADVELQDLYDDPTSRPDQMRKAIEHHLVLARK